MHFSTRSFAVMLFAMASLSWAIPLPHPEGGGFTKTLSRDLGNHLKRADIRSGTCDRPKTYRKAWHHLTAAQRKAYIDAEVCLMKLPARLSKVHPSVKSLFDDMQAVHQVQSPWIHNNGWFLPFHRYHMFAHETLLREACNYTGGQPYWDEARDAGKFSLSSIFDPETGFGGSGDKNNKNCISDGPFKDYTLVMGPGYENTTHCLERSLNNTASLMSEQRNVDACMKHTEFSAAWPCLEDLPHRGGHNSVGGEMANPISSPGDPLFYMHHTYVDKLWWEWQQGDLEKRLTDIAGMTTTRKPESGWVKASLNDTLTSYGLVPDLKIGEIMDIEGDKLCYDYF
ncbi:hypothetical protein DFH27DRAFT_524926 [Peziza echinospora]|nr:hypothetical protein DFH27DRAFT_524926 [Peziza echinospora]